jgi:hypothetical protein
MKDDQGNVPELERLRAQREQLVNRLRTPWWYLAAYGFTLALTCAVPIVSHYFNGAGAWSGLLGIVVFYLLQQALAQTWGVSVGTRTLRYPSGRAAGIALMVVVIVASVVEIALLRRDLLAAAIVVGVLATLAGVACWWAHLRGIRYDLRTGGGAI